MLAEYEHLEKVIDMSPERDRGRADCRFVPSQWETALLCNDVSHWLGVSLESALLMVVWQLPYIDGLVQERRNSSALALELRLSCTKPSISARHLWHILALPSLIQAWFPSMAEEERSIRDDIICVKSLFIMAKILLSFSGWGLGSFLRWWPP